MSLSCPPCLHRLTFEGLHESTALPINRVRRGVCRKLFQLRTLSPVLKTHRRIFYRASPRRLEEVGGVNMPCNYLRKMIAHNFLTNFRRKDIKWTSTVQRISCKNGSVNEETIVGLLSADLSLSEAHSRILAANVLETFPSHARTGKLLMSIYNIFSTVFYQIISSLLLGILMKNLTRGMILGI